MRRVRNSGEIIWHKQPVYISLALVGETGRHRRTGTGDHVVRLCDLHIGLIDRLQVFRRFGPRRDEPNPASNTEPSQKVIIIPVQNQPSNRLNSLWHPHPGLHFR